MNPLKALQDMGQSVWLDYIQRSMLDGDLNKMIVEDGLRGVTSNPSIFEKAIGGSTDYDAAIEALVAANPDMSAKDVFYELAIDDIQRAADMLRPVYETSKAHDGYVSIEVSPDLAMDAQATVEEARKIHAQIDRPNVMIKVPSTRPGLEAIEQLISEGISINATLLFSVKRYQMVAEAFVRGLEKRAQRGDEVKNIASVASFFVSRVDSKVDAALMERMDAGHAGADKLVGKIAITNAKLAYQCFQTLFTSERFNRLAESGAQPQRILWASTGTKNPEFSDVMYIDELIATQTVNTIPPATMDAFRDHGVVKATLEQGMDQAEGMLSELANYGVDLAEITVELEKQGVALFAESFQNLLKVIEGKMEMMRKGQAHG